MRILATDEHRLAQMNGAKDFSLKPVTEQIIGAAFEVHSALGYGFLERVYQKAMQVELMARGIEVDLEPQIKVQFKGVVVGDYAADLLVAKQIIVELKVDTTYQSIHEAQLLNELRGTGDAAWVPDQFWTRKGRI
jgi:GxxExxY protein